MMNVNRLSLNPRTRRYWHLFPELYSTTLSPWSWFGLYLFGVRDETTS